MICRSCSHESPPLDLFCGRCGARLGGDGQRDEVVPAKARRGHAPTPFVNRTEERRLLRSRFEQAGESEGQVVFLSGEAGIGKSRLLQMLREDIADTPHTWIESAATSDFASTPFHAWTRVLEQLLAVGTHGVASSGSEALAAALRRAGLDERRALPLVAPLLDIAVPAGYMPVLPTPEVARQRLLATLVEWVLGAARNQTLVILLEDLQWADPSTLELQALLAEQGATERLLLLYTARPQFVTPWPERGHHTHLTVNRLLKRHVLDMVQGVSARSSLLSEVIEQLAARTDGVPLFVEELTKAVIEMGTAAAREIPETLADSLTARIKHLGAAAREVAKVSAVCGREFKHSLIAAVHPIPADELDQALRRLVEAELLYARGFTPEVTYTFKHALVRDTAYASLDDDRRRKLHGHVAAALASQSPALADEHPELLAHHHTEAGEVELAVAKWQRAGEQALQRGALGEAGRHLRRALDLLPVLRDPSERDVRELPLQLALGRVFTHTKGYGSTETAAAYARAREIGERVVTPEQLLTLLNGQLVLSLTRQGPASARPLADELMTAATESGSAWWVAMAHLGQEIISFHAGEFAAAYEHAQLARPSYCTPAPYSVPVDLGLLTLGYHAYSAWHLGRVVEARAVAAELAERADASGRVTDVALGYQILSLFHSTMLRDLKVAGACAQRVLDACADQPNPVPESCARSVQGWILAHEGEPEAGANMIRQALDVFVSTGQRLSLGFFLTALADAHILAGQTAEAAHVLEESEGACLGEEHLRPSQLWRRAELAEQSGVAAADVDAAYEEAGECARHFGSKALELRIALSYAKWLCHQSRAAEARALLLSLRGSLGPDNDLIDADQARELLEQLAVTPLQDLGVSPAATV